MLKKSEKKLTETMSKRDSEGSIYRIPPYFYIHVLDHTTNVTHVELGPQTYIRKDNERVLFGPERMVIVPPRHYCVVENPVVRKDGENGSEVVITSTGQVKLAHGEQEVQLAQDPFPLYPGESLSTKVTQLKVIPVNKALHIRAVRDLQDGDSMRYAGDEWLFEGPGTYIPRKEVEVVDEVSALIIKPNHAVRLRATRATKDRDGKERVAGEEWIMRKVGAYLPGVYEKLVEDVDAYVLIEKIAVHVQALGTFVDSFGVKRKNGEEWLVKFIDTDTFIPDVYEEVQGIINITTLTSRQYCVVCNPLDRQGKPQLGQRILVKGEKSFFLRPGQSLEDDIQNVFVLQENEGLILRANEGFTDSSGPLVIQRNPGDRWMITGPTEYVPPVEVKVVTQRTAIPLDENEGIYIRNIKTGKVRAVRGETYLLTQDEELWNKDLPTAIENLLAEGKDALADRGVREKTVNTTKRDRSRVITYRVPHNAAVQVYDYKEKKARVEFGPNLVMLGPDEQFTQLSLSGGKPKKPNTIRALAMLLGPDFCTDIITVETSDHARLSLQLAYNWHFDVGKKTPDDAAALFSVPDFVGDTCKAIASRIRGAVAQVKFDDFHKNSARIIRSSVFGIDENKKIRDSFRFPQNNLVVTSVDIQSVEPVDQRTRDSLQKSVQLAIEITTNSQEATAKHEAERVEQEARGRLERQKILDEAAAEKARRELLELQAASSAVESCGQSKGEAQSRAEASKIEGQAAVDQAKLKAEAADIEAASELRRLEQAREAEIKYIEDQNRLEIAKTKELAEIDITKFQQMVDAIGQETLKAMSTAGVDHQVRLLQSLGLQSTLITDGHTPINLLNTAQGLIGMPTLKEGGK